MGVRMRDVLSRDVLQKLQGFDERYFVYCEDVDLSLRTSSLGFSIGLVPAARIYHKVSRSQVGRKSNGLYYYVRNNLLLFKTHAGEDYYQAAARFLFQRMRENMRLIFHRRLGTIGSLSQTARGVLDHLRERYGRMGTYQKRLSV